MEINPKDPKTLSAAVLIIAGALGAGSMLGLTIEPEETTALRVENCVLKERTTNLEEEVTDLTARVEQLESIVQACREVVDACKTDGG